MDSKMTAQQEMKLSGLHWKPLAFTAACFVHPVVASVACFLTGIKLFCDGRYEEIKGGSKTLYDYEKMRGPLRKSNVGIGLSAFGVVLFLLPIVGNSKHDNLVKSAGFQLDAVRQEVLSGNTNIKPREFKSKSQYPGWFWQRTDEDHLLVVLDAKATANNIVELRTKLDSEKPVRSKALYEGGKWRELSVQ